MVVEAQMRGKGHLHLANMYVTREYGGCHTALRTIVQVGDRRIDKDARFPYAGLHARKPTVTIALMINIDGKS